MKCDLVERLPLNTFKFLGLNVTLKELIKIWENLMIERMKESFQDAHQKAKHIDALIKDQGK